MVKAKGRALGESGFGKSGKQKKTRIPQPDQRMQGYGEALSEPKLKQYRSKVNKNQ